jgi:hypothetical protein
LRKGYPSGFNKGYSQDLRRVTPGIYEGIPPTRIRKGITPTRIGKGYSHNI